MTGNGAKNVILGRQDGTIEVYNVNVRDALDSSILIYTLVSNNFFLLVGTSISTSRFYCYKLKTCLLDNVALKFNRQHCLSNISSDKYVKTQ